MSSLAAPLALSAALVVVTCAIQIVGLAILIWVMRFRDGRRGTTPNFLRQMGVILVVVTGLFLVHTVQVWIYAVAYLALNEFETFETALYFSTSSFTTVGYGEIYMESRWRIVSAIQSANGFLVLGWSTVFLISAISRLRSVEIDWLERREERYLFDLSRKDEND
ncbi:MAG: potassium channel family protein [Pseudomonadota bacterium]